MQNQYYWGLTDEEEYIAHHGILGQKWGIRRYQNEDGSLTEEGKRRIYGGGRFESSYNRMKRARKTVQYNKKVDSAAKKLEKSIEKGDAEKIQKNKANLDYLKKTRDIYMKDLSEEEIELGEKYLQNNAAWITGLVIAGPIGGLGAELATSVVNGTWKTAREVDKQNRARREQYLNEMNKEREEAAQSNSNKQETTGSGEKKMSSKEINDKVAYARKTGKYDMEFLERNGDLNADGDEKLKGKDLDDAYKKYLEKHGYSGNELHK